MTTQLKAHVPEFDGCAGIKVERQTFILLCFETYVCLSPHYVHDLQKFSREVHLCVQFRLPHPLGEAIAYNYVFL